MDHLIPSGAIEMTSLKERPVNEELIAQAIASVIRTARTQGQSLEEITHEVLTDHSLLEEKTRVVLCEILQEAWGMIAVDAESLPADQATTSDTASRV
jgi:hypothetical protein